MAVKTSICFRMKTWRGFKCSSSSSCANNSREECSCCDCNETDCGGAIEGLTSVVKEMGFEESFDIVRAFLAGLVVIEDGSGVHLLPELVELEPHETSLALPTETTDNLLEDFSLIGIMSSFSNPSFHDNKDSVLDEERLLLPIDTGT